MLDHTGWRLKDGEISNRTANLSAVHLRHGTKSRHQNLFSGPLQMLDVVQLSPAPDEVVIVFYIQCNVVHETPRCTHPTLTLP